ncbi:cytochrome c biogenesis protein [Salibacteraceae bacterium]|jgi:heme exporter protein C|nr:cytochrome c biogenesis protein [Salibacteraceae bacterium]
MWWKILGVFLVLYAIVGGLLIEVPRLPILNETIRNLYFHVTMWFSMIILLTASLVHSIQYLSSGSLERDTRATETASVGILLGLLGVITGSLWAKFTWGAYWVNDPKLNGAAITILIYLAYNILRGSLEDPKKRARISAVYNIFAYVLLIVFLIILPRVTDSLHPGNGGNPAFSTYDLDNNMRLVFYPAIIGWSLIGFWMVNLRRRLFLLESKDDD